MIILKLIGYGLLSAIIGTILFFCIGLYFEVSERESETKLKYNSFKKEYYKQDVVIEENISGDTTSYFAIAGMVIGLIVGILIALDDTPTKKPIPTDINSEQTNTTK